MTYIKFNGCYYGPRRVFKGVIQGGILSPLIYLLYQYKMNVALGSVVKNIQYADDLTLYSAHSSFSSAVYNRNKGFTRAALKVLRKSKTEQTSKLLVLFYLFKIVSIHINTSLHPMEPLRKALCPLVLRGLFDGHLKRSHCFLGVHKTFSSKFFFYFRE